MYVDVAVSSIHRPDRSTNQTTSTSVKLITGEAMIWEGSGGRLGFGPDGRTDTVQDEGQRTCLLLYKGFFLLRFFFWLPRCIVAGSILLVLTTPIANTMLHYGQLVHCPSGACSVWKTIWVGTFAFFHTTSSIFSITSMRSNLCMPVMEEAERLDTKAQPVCVCVSVPQESFLRHERTCCCSGGR